MQRLVSYNICAFTYHFALTSFLKQVKIYIKLLKNKIHNIVKHTNVCQQRNGALPQHDWTGALNNREYCVITLIRI